jgi:hypothetical protein
MSAVATSIESHGVGAVDAFICCTPAETKESSAIRQLLEDRGIRCPLSAWGMRPGRQPIMILLLTKRTIESQAIEQEVGRTVYRGLPLVVLRLEGVQPQKKLAYYLTLRPYHRLDALRPPLEQYIDRLLQLIELALSNFQAEGAESRQRFNEPEAERHSVGAAYPSRFLASRSPDVERIAFISYSATDLDFCSGGLLPLLARFHSELEIQFGCAVRIHRSADEDPADLAKEKEIRSAIAEADFFIPIVTPAALVSGKFEIEFRCFLDRESRLERDDLVFPLLYSDITELTSEQSKKTHRTRLIVERNWFDWRDLRNQPVTSPDVARGAAQFCRTIATQLQRNFDITNAA